MLVPKHWNSLENTGLGVGVLFIAVLFRVLSHPLCCPLLDSLDACGVSVVLFERQILLEQKLCLLWGHNIQREAKCFYSPALLLDRC